MPIADPPSAPRKLHVTLHEKNTVHLAWSPPEQDGGAPIRRYIIEGQCEDDKDFRLVESSGFDLRYFPENKLLGTNTKPVCYRVWGGWVGRRVTQPC